MKPITQLREQLANSIAALVLADMGFRWFARECRFERWKGDKYEYISVDCITYPDGCTITSCAGIGFRKVAALLKKCPLISSRFRSMCETARPVSYAIQILPPQPNDSWFIKDVSDVEDVSKHYSQNGVPQGVSLFSRLDTLEQLIEHFKSQEFNASMPETGHYILAASMYVNGDTSGAVAELAKYIDRQNHLYANPRIPSARLAEIANAEYVLSWFQCLK